MTVAGRNGTAATPCALPAASGSLRGLGGLGRSGGLRLGFAFAALLPAAALPRLRSCVPPLSQPLPRLGLRSSCSAISAGCGCARRMPITISVAVSTQKSRARGADGDGEVDLQVVGDDGRQQGDDQHLARQLGAVGPLLPWQEGRQRHIDAVAQHQAKGQGHAKEPQLPLVIRQQH